MTPSNDDKAAKITLKDCFSFSDPALKDISFRICAFADLDPMTFWDAADAKARRSICWDIPQEYRPLAFYQSAKKAAFHFAAYEKGQPLALFWFEAITPGGASFIPHFLFTKRSAKALPIAAIFLKCVDFTMLALIPKPWRHAIKFAEYAGFRIIAELPAACALADHNRICSGVLMLREIER